MKTYCATLQGIEARVIDVEVDISNGLPCFGIVGLADVSIRESKERIRSCLKNSKFKYPVARISINLAPADTYKYGTQFDLPIAMGILSASGQIQFDPAKTMFLGELSMSGKINAVRGVLSMVVAAKEAGFKRVLVPKKNEEEASIVDGMNIIPCTDLFEVIHKLHSDVGVVRQHDKAQNLKVLKRGNEVDFSDVIGQNVAKRVLEIAAAGGHNVLMVGPPGVGKTLLAKALPSIIPEPSSEKLLEIIKTQSAAGLAESGFNPVPFRTPHHNITVPGFVGGGKPPRPGEVSLAHGGVLFLDELPEFPKSVLENLREPLENCRILVSRFNSSFVFPADFIFVAAQNPCPCGYYGDGRKECTCSVARIASYHKKISGPVMDRIDLRIKMSRENALGGVSESSESIKERVGEARARQMQRQGKLNKSLSRKEIELFAKLEPDALKLLNHARDKMAYSLRAYHKLIKISLTISDLSGASTVSAAHASEALSYRFLE